MLPEELNRQTRDTGEPNNVNSNFLITILFYVISSILLIGVVINLISMTQYGLTFKHNFLNSFSIIKWISNILVWLSVIYFPVVAFYLFTVLYKNQSKELF